MNKYAEEAEKHSKWSGNRTQIHLAEREVTDDEMWKADW
jgi:hypothetical protein